MQTQDWRVTPRRYPLENLQSCYAEDVLEGAVGEICNYEIGIKSLKYETNCPT